MKLITNLSIIAALVAAFGTSAAFADDPQLQNRLAVQRAQAQGNERATTVAVYAVKGNALGRTDSKPETTIAFSGHNKSIGREVDKADRGEQHWMEVTTPHGTVTYFSPAK
jgi:hypothetical protein